MNVDQYFDTVVIEPPTRETWAHLINLREATFRGFAEVEQSKGFVQPTVNFHTSRGQDTIRLLGYRVIEELTESIRADDSTTHKLEELIDALNYLLSIPLLDPQAVRKDRLVEALHQAVVPTLEQPLLYWGRLSWFITGGGYTEIVQDLTWVLGDTLRNRAWMNHAQDLYFSNSDALIRVVTDSALKIITCFEDWDQFCTYFLAKDEVLQFRLKSKY